METEPEPLSRSKKRKVAEGLAVLKLPKKLNPDVLPMRQLRKKIATLDKKQLTRYKKQLLREIKRFKREDLVELLEDVEDRMEILQNSGKRNIQSKLRKLFCKIISINILN